MNHSKHRKQWLQMKVYSQAIEVRAQDILIGSSFSLIGLTVYFWFILFLTIVLFLVSSHIFNIVFN